MPVQPFWGLVVKTLPRDKKYLAVLLAIVLATTGLAGCLSEDGNGGTKWGKPTKITVSAFTVDETGEKVVIDFTLGDAKDLVTQADGTLRVAIWDSDDFEMLNKTYDISAKDFFVFKIGPLKSTNYTHEIAFSELAKSHDWGYNGLGEFSERKMHTMAWFEYKGDTFSDGWNIDMLNPEIPDALLHPNEAPHHDLVGPTAGFTGVEVEYDASASTDPEGGSLDFEWDWGDGDTTGWPLAGDVETHTYDEPGTYTVTVTITDPEDEEATATLDITVEWALSVTVDDWGELTTGDKANNTFVTLTISNVAGVEVSVPTLDPWIIATGEDPVGENGTDVTPPASLAADGEVTITVYFDIPDGFTATAVKVMGREFTL